MNRRSFMERAALVAAHSALGGTLVACGAELNIPCLGPASAPTPVAGMTYLKASEIGCALDCKLETGRNKRTGGEATDDGPRINAAMAGATAKHPITLILDGSALISGLFLPAGGFWNIAGLGCGTGFFIKSGTNNDGIHNGSPEVAVPSDPGPPAPARGMNVSLSNFTINGNAGDGKNGDSTSGLRQGVSNRTWYFGINLMNLNNVSVENLVLVNMPAYHIRFSNVGHVSASGCVMRSFGVNTDGLHFDGPANDITISHCDFTMEDDSIALNAPEGYSGDIVRVAVSNCTFNSFSLMRLYTTGPSPLDFIVDRVTVQDCNGTFSEAAFNIGFLVPSRNENPIDMLAVSNCTLTAPAVLEVAEDFGGISLSSVTLIPRRSDRPSGLLRPSRFSSNKIHGSRLSLTDCVISRTSDIDAAALILNQESILDDLIFTGFSVQDAASYHPVSELLNMRQGTIGQVVLSSLASQNVKSLVQAGSFFNIGSVSGDGVLATGWEFPDAVMQDGVPYISASTGEPSIKVSGVVEAQPHPARP